MRRGERLYTVVGVTAVGETWKALRVDIGNGKGPVWIPRTQLARRSKVQKVGDQGVLVVSEWIAKQVGWMR